MAAKTEEPTASNALISMFLEIKGIPGDAGSEHGSIQVLGYSNQIDQKVVKRRGIGETGKAGGVAGEVLLGDFIITKPLDSASPLLAQKCCLGDPIEHVTLTLVRAGGGGVPYMVYIMTNVLISSFTPSAGPQDAWPTEMVGFSYEGIEWEYTQQKRKDGTGGGHTTGRY